ncbi:unnamed protein product [Polarella glacialis]|uniref:Glycosyltransferase 2-like domain-containing protein n=1 Tax=Polarella glacialis TaxID=89957 RepID=A0A813EK34_POLGL|nr:unnamed protein product [Polarella glacialis]
MSQHLGLPAEWLLRYWAVTVSEQGSMAGDVDDARCAILAGLGAGTQGPLLEALPYVKTYMDSVHVPLLFKSLDLRAARILTLPAPAVSWLMPVKDAPTPWLREALASIERQVGMGPGSWELVVVDDGSEREDTRATLAQWEQLPQVRVIRLDRNRGIGAALNEGWRCCRGAHVARLDADDVAHPERLSKQLTFLENHPSIAVLGGGFRTFKSDGLDSAAGTASVSARQFRMPCHPFLTRWHMLFSCSLAHPTVTMRRQAIDEVIQEGQAGPYPEDEEAEDHCCWLQLPLSIQMANLADVVCFLGRHPGSRTSAAAAAIQKSSYVAVRQFLAQYCGQDKLTDEDIAILWGKADPKSAEQAQRTSQALDAVEQLFLRMLQESSDSESSAGATPGHWEDFLASRAVALEDYVRTSCSKLRGLLTVQSLAAGDIDVGSEMMKQWLKGGDAGLKSLGALINAGFQGQGS